jgi:hypothetical protein
LDYTTSARCVLDRAYALFSEHMDPTGMIRPGSYVRNRAGLAVALSIDHKGQMLLSIVKLYHDRLETMALEPVFRARWRTGETVHIMEWVDSAWERAFLAWDA